MGLHADATLQELLKRLKELKASEIPDPAESEPQLPLGSGAIVEKRRLGLKELRLGTPRKLETAVQRNESAESARQLRRLNTFMNRARKASKGWEQESLGKVPRLRLTNPRWREALQACATVRDGVRGASQCGRASVSHDM